MSVCISHHFLKLHRQFGKLSRRGLVTLCSNVFQYHRPRPVSFNVTCLTERNKANLNLSNYYPITNCEVLAGRQISSGFHTSSVNCHGEYEWEDPKSEEDVVTVQFLDKDGKSYSVRGKIGDNLLYLAKRFEVEMEGACEASLACTTCHVYVDQDFLDTLPEATETEEDLLDQAPFLKENSRLDMGWGSFPGCQIILNKQLDGLKLTLPAVTKNFYVDGHKPTPH